MVQRQCRLPRPVQPRHAVNRCMAKEVWLVGNGKVVIRPRDQTGLMRKMVIGFLVSSPQPRDGCTDAAGTVHAAQPPSHPHLRALSQQAQLLLERVLVQLSQVPQLADGDALQGWRREEGRARAWEGKVVS